MSHSAGLDAVRSASPGSLKRKRNTPNFSHSSTNFSNQSPHFMDGAAPVNGDSLSVKQYRSPDSDGANPSDSGDLLHGVGSTSSLASNSSSVFSHNSQAFGNNRNASLANGLTPLTSRSESSPRKVSSPPFATAPTAMASTNGAFATSHISASDTTLESTSGRTSRPQMLPRPGKAKGYRVVWDPELDGKLGKEERKRATLRKREFGAETYPPDPPPDPRLAIPGYMSGNCRAKDRPSKATLRIAPYNLPPYKIDRNSIGPGESQQVVVLGFDPFTPEANLRHIFSAFGSIASVQNKTDPETGSFLGIALIKYRDSIREDGITATIAARMAETKMNGERIGVHPLKVEVDREGRKFQRHVEHALRKTRAERPRESAVASAPPPPPPSCDSGLPANDSPAPPLNAPKGPSAKSSAKSSKSASKSTTTAAAAAASKLSETPREPPSRKTGPQALIEDEPILSKIKRKPYIHIPHRVVPVLGTTIPHLKKRLKAYDWRELRLDRTGYYVIFEDSKRGEDETERTFNECNMGALFTYKMAMECQKYGNPDYERTPSPERVIAEKQTRETFERLKREQEEDLEIEKKRRAENLNPVYGALEQLRIELRDRILSDIKTRIAIPIFHDSLDPSKHIAKRRKLGLPDASDSENKTPTLLFNKSDAPFYHSKSRHALSHSKPLRPHDPNKQRGRKGDRERDRAPVNAFVDERRRKPPAKPSQARGLHFKLQQMFAEDEDSDDERRTSVTRDTEDQESRPLSRASRNSTPFDSESVTETTPKHKTRKVADWDEEDKEEKEVFDGLQRQLLGHLLHKEPEDLATRELELVVNTLPRTSKYAVRAKTELYLRQRSKDDDDLFQVEPISGKVDVVMEDVSQTAVPKDSTLSVRLDAKTVKEKAKRKRKTKKQLIEEQEALEAEAKEAEAAKKPVAQETVAKIEAREQELEEAEEEVESSDIAWKFTHDRPRRTVESERDVVLDIDGWQRVLKDDEDIVFAKKAFAEEPVAKIGDAKLWAWKQKEIKALNSGISGSIGLVQSEIGIDGYYVPNPSGCARTEGYKKILNEEKSKYLPHRIKVQKAREVRQAQAKANPSAVAEAAKLAAAEKIASTATSRSNRVNNRRLVNDINMQKQSLTTANSDADVAIRFNQLKKRKKLVKFDRSAIHGWGLYAEENIAVNDLIIEYVGEKVRQKIADLREIKYDRQGVGSSYLFRMIDDEIVDATKKGGIARFINHSCNPNCTAKIIKVEGTPRIVIYALKDIYKNEELTYDYKFEREYGSTDRIPCLCGSANCKGFLN